MDPKKPEYLPTRVDKIEAAVKELKARRHEAPHVFHALVGLAQAPGFDFSKLETLYDQLQALYALQNGPRTTAPTPPNLRTFADSEPAADKPIPEPSEKPETRRREEIAQARCDLFNSLYPVGASLFVRFEQAGPLVQTTANSPAYLDRRAYHQPRAMVAINHPERCNWVLLPLSHVHGHDI